MKNKDKYDLRKINWQVERGKSTGYIIHYSTKIFYCENSHKELITSVEGGSHIDFLNWLESEAKDD